jgi:hypothetical protein
MAAERKYLRYASMHFASNWPPNLRLNAQDRETSLALELTSCVDDAGSPRRQYCRERIAGR